MPRLIGRSWIQTFDPATPLYAATAPRLVARGRDRVAALLGDGRRFTTVMLWCAFIASFTFIGQWSSWSTTIFKDVLHMDWKSVAKMTTLYSTLGVVGASTIGIAIDRFGFRAVLPMTYALAFLGAVGVGFTAPGSPMFVFLGMMGCSFVPDLLAGRDSPRWLRRSIRRATGQRRSAGPMERPGSDRSLDPRPGPH